MFVVLVMVVFWPELALWLPASHECTAMTDRHASYPTGLKDAPTRHRALRQRMAAPGIVVAPGAYDCITARLVEVSGFDALYVTGLRRLDERARRARHGRLELRRDPRPRAPHLRFGRPSR